MRKEDKKKRGEKKKSKKNSEEQLAATLSDKLGVKWRETKKYLRRVEPDILQETSCRKRVRVKSKKETATAPSI